MSTLLYLLIGAPLMTAPLVYAVWIAVKGARVAGQANALLAPVAAAFGLTRNREGR